MEYDPIRFYLDENLSPEIAVQLAADGIDVIRGKLRDSDLNHLQRASALGRVVCTRDKDFNRLHKTIDEHAGIIKGHNSLGIGDWVKYLRFVHATCAADDMRNSVEFVFPVD